MFVLSEQSWVACRSFHVMDRASKQGLVGFLVAVLLIMNFGGVFGIAKLDSEDDLIPTSRLSSVRDLTTIWFSTAASVSTLSAAGLPLTYPFVGVNMFFGLTTLKEPRDYGFAGELNVSWVSMQPVAVWFSIESSPGQYNWSGMDREVAALQQLGLDCSVVLIPMNAFGEKRVEIASQLQNEDVDSFLRTPESAAMMLYPNNETLPVWTEFVKAIVDRYDGDGVNDMLGLRYPVRNWHFSEEYPEFYIPAQVYVDLLKITYPVIKETDPQATVILHGIASNLLQYIAFVKGFIDDPDAGVINGTAFTKIQIAARYRDAFRDVEYFLEEGKGYYDAVDVHLYEPKETFLKGKVNWMISALQELDVNVPIWCIEGGGPFKLREGQQSQFGDQYWGIYTDKENAEFVVKMHVMAAATGIERFHWGLCATGEDDYWSGPWNNMALATYEREKKPAFYTFKIMLEKLRDFKKANDLSVGEVNLYEFEVGSEKVYVAWANANNTVDLSQQSSIGKCLVKITHIVTELDDGGEPVAVAEEIQSSTRVNLSNTPIIISSWIVTTADLDGDGIVSRSDISIVAEAFGARSGELDWSDNADLDKNGTINIIDISIVARALGIAF
jgi:hypothetical protein